MLKIKRFYKFLEACDDEGLYDKAVELKQKQKKGDIPFMPSMNPEIKKENLLNMETLILLLSHYSFQLNHQEHLHIGYLIETYIKADEV